MYDVRYARTVVDILEGVHHLKVKEIIHERGSTAIQVWVNDALAYESVIEGPFRVFDGPIIEKVPQ